MSFIVGSVIIGAGAVIGGALISSKGSKKSSEIAAAGSDREIAYLEESRDLARGDQAPYREAGYTALDALMSMTGLAGSRRAAPASPSNRGVTGDSTPSFATANLDNPRALINTSAPGGRLSMFNGPNRFVPDTENVFSRNHGGALYGRNSGGSLYNINELGPESVYENGSYTRSSQPKTVPPSSGYVAPNIQGRYVGGNLVPEPVGVSDPNPTLLQAGPLPAQNQQLHVQPDGSVRPGADIPQLQAGPTYGTQGDYINSSLPDKNDIKYGDSQLPVQNQQLHIQPDGSVRPGADQSQLALGGAQPGGGIGARFPGIQNSGQISPFGNQQTPNNGGSATIDNATGAPIENPGGVEGGYNFMTDPGYGFRIGEGQRALERSAAARGGLLSGGFGRKLTRYAQDYASNEYTNVYNRISNIAGLGQVAAQGSGNAALYAGAGMGTAAAQSGLASAYGNQAGTNAWANAANQIGQLPWENIFNKGGVNKYDQRNIEASGGYG